MNRQTPAFLRGWAFFWLILAGAGALAGCGAHAGDACQAPADCPGSLCLTKSDGFAGGYCSADCAATGCGEGQDCRPLGERAVCLARCQGGGCRAGYQCYQGVCQPACTTDDSCGDRGYLCQAGTCVERPGAKLGAACASDDECSSSACVAKKCVQLCDRDPACKTGETCTLDRAAETLRGYCVPKRGGAAPLASEGCKADGDCDRGSCLMGACLLLCQTPSDCGAAQPARGCSKLPAPLTKISSRADWPTAKVCLPRNQNLVTDISQDKDLLVPDTARSVMLFMSVDDFDEQTQVGMQVFRDPSRRLLFQWNENDPSVYFRNPIRHYPDAGAGAFLFSSSPQRAPVQLGAYPFEAQAQDVRGGTDTPRVQAIYKLFDSPLKQGKIPLRVHVTSMSGLPSGCAYRGMTAQDTETRLGTMLKRVKEIYAQGPAGLRLDPITFVDSSAPSSVDANTQGGLERTLRAASENTGGGLDLVLVRSIAPNGVLGIAGGIPASPGIKGSPHTGAVASMVVLCIAQFNIGQEEFAVTVAHELGHTMGLSHNREQSGQSDPLGDGTGRSESYLQNTDNLMYWAEGDNPGVDLTEEQGLVMRSMPQVQP